MVKKHLFILLLTLIYSCTRIDNNHNFNPEAIKLQSAAHELIGRVEYDSALLLLNRALMLDSSYYVAYNSKANIYLHLNLADSAIMQLEQVLKLKPDFAEVWSSAGMLYERKGDLARSKDYYEKSVSLYNARIENSKNLEKDILRSNRVNRAFNLILAGRKEEGIKEVLLLKQEEPGAWDTIILNRFLTQSREEILDDYTPK